MTNRRAAALVLLAVAVLGLVVGFWPRSLPATFGDGTPCGSAFAPDTEAAYVDDLAAEMRGDEPGEVASCDEALSGSRTVALVLLGGAALGGLGLAVTRRQEDAPQPQS